MNRLKWLVVAAPLAMLGCAGSPEKKSDEVKVSMQDLPAPVKATLDKELGDGKITDIDKEAKDGETVYEADATIGGKDYEIKIAEDGSFLSKKIDTDKNEKCSDKD